MSDKTPRPNGNGSPQRPYRISAMLREKLGKQKKRYWNHIQRLRSVRRNYWLQTHSRLRDPIRGMLVTHRRMFGVSHKSVQPGQSPLERGS